MNVNESWSNACHVHTEWTSKKASALARWQPLQRMATVSHAFQLFSLSLSRALSLSHSLSLSLSPPDTKTRPQMHGGSQSSVEEVVSRLCQEVTLTSYTNLFEKVDRLMCPFSFRFGAVLLLNGSPALTIPDSPPPIASAPSGWNHCLDTGRPAADKW